MANIDKSFHNGGYTLRIAYTINSQSAANNSTNITAEVHLISKGSGYNINSSTAKNGTLSINGTSYSFSANVSLSSGQDKTLFTKTVDVPHNSDGTKTCALSCSLDIQVTLSGTKYNTISVSGNVTFNTIGRNTTVTTSGTYKFGTKMTINHSRASTAYTITLRYTCGNSSGTIITKQATNSTNWTPPKSLQSEVPKATSIGITIYCDTYNGNTLLGTTSTSFTCTIADDCKPSLGTLSCSNPDTSGTTYWQGVSKLRVEVGYTKAYNSEIAKYVMEVDGQTITNYGYIIWSGTLTGSGAKDVKITITDQRGRSVSKTYSKAITVTAYSKPNITKFTCKRTGTDESGHEVISNLGTIGYFTYAVSWHSSSSNKTRKFMYKPTTSSSWTTVSISNDSYNDYKFSTSLATGSAYDLRIQVSDQVTTVTQDIKMNNLFPLINLSADGTAIAFGKECNANNKFMVSMNASFNNDTDIYNCNVTNKLDIKNGYIDFSGLQNWNNTGVSNTGGGAGIVNDNINYKSLMIVGNNTYGNGYRQVSVWDDLQVKHDLYVDNKTHLSGDLCINALIYSQNLYNGVGNGQVSNISGDGKILYVGNPKLTLQLESASHVKQTFGTEGVYNLITSRNYKQATWLWSGTLTNGNSVTLTNATSYSLILVYGRPSGSTALVCCPVTWNIINAGSLYCQMCTESSYIKFLPKKSGNDVIISYTAGSNGKIEYIYGVC